MNGVPTDMKELAIKYQKAETRLKEVETLNDELQLKLVEPLRSAGVSKVSELKSGVKNLHTHNQTLESSLTDNSTQLDEMREQFSK
ncbi:hypothetical protein EB796_009416 [Bugula neritina]|uniref:Uncharacterized protein n=1 Tax=Bugula neritina TaxID=10212 RepID=A0A7J7K269_BUGNE|nr:hypothetical protein EB796_009416 [Bugula neritina]